MLNPSLKYISLSKDEYKKYARHLILDNIGISGQKRLKKAQILIVGLGGLASSAIIYLTAAGIENIGIIDSDKVDQSNLHRQVLYTNEDINKLKVDCAKLKIHQINPNCQVTIFPYKLNQHNSTDLIKNYDIIIDACDNFKTRYIIDSACYKLHKIHIYGAIKSFEGQISVFNYKGGPKYSDLYPESLKLENNNCNTVGVVGIITGIVGLLQATETIKIILGTGEILSGQILIYNALNTSFNKIKINCKQIVLKTNYQKDKKSSDIKLISNNTAKKLLHKNNIIFIDVRQNIEFKKSHIKKALNIPLKYIKNKSTQKFILSYCLNKTIIIYCSHNSRAIIASQILHKQRINHYRLENGFIQ
uniref:Probable molybdopterin-synthase adenylyltransferase n=1 Tax=Sebdenia flabellata TaxID=42024 RepID=A0A1C9CA44_9FLOR|nr:molybdopterin biosynthesis protein [Sebdenia flabellata]AOM65248.1 molybdopterin biosynthesis protein [Sebdenia flabellata]